MLSTTAPSLRRSGTTAGRSPRLLPPPLRLPLDRPARPVADPVSGEAPVVLFLPARNEAPRIAGVLARTPMTVCGRRVIRLVVDDGSTDDTVPVAEGVGAEVVRHHEPLGLGAAVRTGLAAAVDRGAAAVAFCDADGEYDPADLERVVGPALDLDGGADYVVGSRFAGRIEWMRPHRRLGNRMLTRWVRWTAREPVTDGQSGYRALSARAARSARIAHDYNYAQVLTLDLLGQGFRYAEVPITYRFRTTGRSFVRLPTYLRRVVPAVLRVVRELHEHVGTPNDPGIRPTSNGRRRERSRSGSV
jgi:glycosyltransferase involved in cell wall biosynthesis